jgi:hypothetical protein
MSKAETTAAVPVAGGGVREATMSKAETTAAVPVAGGGVREARFRAGEVHWQGARSITHVTTDRTTTTIAGTHILHVDELALHPAGLLIKVDGERWVVPHVRVETYRLA